MLVVLNNCENEAIHTQYIGLQLLLQEKKLYLITLSKQSNKNVLIIQQNTHTIYNIQYNKLCSLSIIDTNPPVRCIADRFVEFDLLL